MRRGKGCRQGLETPENLVALRAVGRCTSECASTSNTTWFLFDSASYEEVTNAWREQVGWNQMYLSDDLHLAANGWRS